MAGGFDKSWRDYTPQATDGLGKPFPPNVSPVARSKYRSVPHVVLASLEVVLADDPRADGARRFDSKREAARYVALREEFERGRIGLLELQKQFPLHVIGPDGVKVCIGRYIADFAYQRPVGGSMVIEDAKGFRGKELYVWKKKHVQSEYGITVVEV